MIKGSSVHQKIKTKIGEVETQANKFASQIYTIEAGIEKLTAERENCYAVLAENYLPEFDAKAVKTTLKEMSDEIESIFREKQERRSTIEKLMKDNKERNNNLESEIDKTTTQIETHTQERDKILAVINDELSKDADYTKIDNEAKKAQTRLQQDQKRVAEVETEAREKIPAFENNKIFSYLIKINYETSSYQQNGFRKKLDSWVAKKIDFSENKKRYDFLKSMPEMMKQEVARRQEELDNIVREMEAIEFRLEKKRGLPEILARANALMNQRQSLIEKDKKLDEQYAAYGKEREQIDNKKDPYYVDAMQKIKEFLKGEQITDLKSRAKKTKGTEDDKKVERIESIDTEIREIKDRAKSAKKERDSYATNLDGLRKVEKRFRSLDYEGSYSYFPDNFNIDDIIAGFLLGRISSSDINSKIDSSQTTRRQTYHSSSSYSSSRSSSRSSGFGGSGGFSSGGGFGGGGFSSGKGF